MSTNSISSIREQIKLLTSDGKMTRSHNETRHCSRCGLPLTDPASWVAGVGPICRGKDNTIFAKTIPANLVMASMIALTLDTSKLPESLRSIWKALEVVIREKSVHGVQNSKNLSVSKHTGEDCREIVNIIDWLLSFRIPYNEKTSLVNVVKHLGFVGLAGVLSGKSSTGEASIIVNENNNGLIKLVGSSNKEGLRAMKGIKLPGHVVTCPRYRGDKTPYSTSILNYEKFLETAIEFWPCFKENIDDLRNQCADWLKNNNITVIPTAQLGFKLLEPIDQRPVAKFGSALSCHTHLNDCFSVSFAWVPDITLKVVNQIKEKINYRARSYDPQTKQWGFTNKSSKELIKNILEESGYRVEV